MKKMYCDYRIFMARTGVITLVKILGVIFAVIIVLGAVRIFAPIPQSAGDFIDGFMYSLTYTIPASCVGMNFSITNFLSPINPGYKLFHFMPDSGKRFRNALLFSSGISLAVTLAVACAIGAYFSVAQTNAGRMNILFAISFVLVSLGLMNFFGFVKALLARIIILVAISGIAGFGCGFSDVEESSSISWTTTASWITLAAGAALWAASIVFVALAAEKRWYCEK